MLAAVEAGVLVVEYTPAEIKRAVVGYGRAEKPQVGQMVKLLLGLDKVPSPHDAADALAVAICHLHHGSGALAGIASATDGRPARAARPQTAGATTSRSGRADRRRPGVPARMIAHLRGRVFEKHPNRVIVDVAGVGYDVLVPLSTFYTCGDPGARSRCAFTRTCARISSRSTDLPRRSSSRCSSG